MFRCRNCNKIDRFELLFSGNYKGKKIYTTEYNEKKELVITADGYSFIPDLAFMNNHAVCKYCGKIYCWEYE